MTLTKVQDFKPHLGPLCTGSKVAGNSIGSFQGGVCRWSGGHGEKAVMSRMWSHGWFKSSKGHGWDKHKANLFMASQLHFSFSFSFFYKADYIVAISTHTLTMFIKTDSQPDSHHSGVCEIQELCSAFTKRSRRSIRLFPFSKQ